MLYGDARVKSLLFKNINFEYKEPGKFIYKKNNFKWKYCEMHLYYFSSSLLYFSI